MPLAGEVVADGLVIAAHRRQFDGGVGEVEVGVLELLEHRRLFDVLKSLKVLRVLLTEQVAGEADGQRLLADTLRTAEHQGVWQTPFAGHLQEALAHLFLANHFVECHIKAQRYELLLIFHAKVVLL